MEQHSITTEYEEIRKSKQRENSDLIKQLGINELKIRKKQHQHRKRRGWNDVETPTRKSQRISELPQQPHYTRPSVKRQKRIQEDEKSQEENEEVYSEKQVALLGTCKRPYPFIMLPKVSCDIRHGGTTCHQCKQCSKDNKTMCCKCKSDKGIICGVCLQIRYGENILEVFKERPNEWVCPSCRGFCNCLDCREEFGFKQIGSMILPKGFQSFAHWIVLTHTRNVLQQN